MKVKEFKKLLKGLKPEDEILCTAYNYDGERQSVEFDTEVFYDDSPFGGIATLVITPHDFETVS